MKPTIGAPGLRSAHVTKSTSLTAIATHVICGNSERTHAINFGIRAPLQCHQVLSQSYRVTTYCRDPSVKDSPLTPSVCQRGGILQQPCRECLRGPGTEGALRASTASHPYSTTSTSTDNMKQSAYESYKTLHLQRRSTTAV